MYGWRAVATSFVPAHNDLVKAFLISEGFDVLGIEGLNTGLKSIEKATLAPLQVYQHVKNVGRKFKLRCRADYLRGMADIDSHSSFGGRYR